MDWWIKLKQMVSGGAAPEAPRAAQRTDPRLPSYIVALCTTDADSAFSINITSLSITGLKIESPRRIAPQALLDIRVPVGLNFEDRNTQEYIAFRVRAVWTKRGQRNTFEAGVRYIEDENEKRDKWLRLVMRSYGMAVGDDRRLQTRHEVKLPCWLRCSDGRVVEVQVRDISTGGMRVDAGDTRLPLRTATGIEFRQTMKPFSIGGQVLHESTDVGNVYGIAFDPLSETQIQDVLDMVSALTREATAES